MTDIREHIRRQLDLEDEGRGIGRMRYRSRDLPWKTEAGAMDEEANLPPGRQFLKVVCEPTAAAIRQFLEEACSGKAGRRHVAADFLLLAEPNEAAYLTARVLINASTAVVTLQNTAINVANAIIENLEMQGFRDINKKGYKGFLKAQEKRGFSRQRRAAVKKLFAAEGCQIDLAHNEKVTLGTKCIELLVEATGLFSIDRENRTRGWVYIIRPTEAIQKWLDEQHARCELLNPMLMPMVVRPRRWRSPTYGGYLTPRPGVRFVKQRNNAYHEELRSMDISNVYAAVNHIQDTAWRINPHILRVLEALWDSGSTLGGLPQREPDPIPSKPVDIDTNEAAREAWKREAARAYTRNAELISGRIAMHQKLWVARKFSEEPAIYFPHELDFRGRVYPTPAALTPQGDDTSKGLLMFAEGKPLGAKGGMWLAIHIANLFGVDKVSFQKRLDWTWANTDAILAAADDPFGNRLWVEADSPFCALAACIEWAGFIREGDGYISHLPIALDGSCSGLQHFSAMLRDPVGGEAVNLTPSAEPQDVYKRVGAKAQEMADADDETYARRWPNIAGKKSKAGEEEVELDQFRKVWANGSVSRSIAKRPTMTYCYSATRFGMQKMVLQTLNEIDLERSLRGEGPYLGGASNYHAATWMSYALWEAISEVVVAAAEAMDWLRQAARVASEADLPIWWTTPVGLPVLQEYKAQEGHRVKAHWAGQRVDLMIHVEGSHLDKRAQANGIAPNFVHSLDASHLMLVALGAKRRSIHSMAVIHDSFGTHACDTDLLADILRDTFVEQYTPDVLGAFRDELKRQLPEELQEQLPPPPKPGSLNLHEVRASSYVFA